MSALKTSAELLEETLLQEYGKSLYEVSERLGYSQRVLEIIRSANHASNTNKMRIISDWVAEDLTFLMLSKTGMFITPQCACTRRAFETFNPKDKPGAVCSAMGVERMVYTCIAFSCKGLNGEDPFIDIRGLRKRRCEEERAILLYRDMTAGRYLLIDWMRENPDFICMSEDKESQDGVWRYHLNRNHKTMRQMTLMGDEVFSCISLSQDKAHESDTSETSEGTRADDASRPLDAADESCSDEDCARTEEAQDVDSMPSDTEESRECFEQDDGVLLVKEDDNQEEMSAIVEQDADVEDGHLQDDDISLNDVEDKDESSETEEDVEEEEDDVDENEEAEYGEDDDEERTNNSTVVYLNDEFSANDWI